MLQVRWFVTSKAIVRVTPGVLSATETLSALTVKTLVVEQGSFIKTE